MLFILHQFNDLFFLIPFNTAQSSRTVNYTPSSAIDVILFCSFVNVHGVLGHHFKNI